MQFLDAIKKVESDDCFSQPKGSYLVHGFLSVDDGKRSEWQIGYYDPKADTITAYIFEDGEIVRSEPAEVFKKGSRVERLDRSKVSISAEKALDKAEKLREKKYSAHPVSKVILLLQKLPLGQVYNITMVTKTFNMMNVKISSETGKTLEESFSSLMELKEN